MNKFLSLSAIVSTLAAGCTAPIGADTQEPSPIASTFTPALSAPDAASCTPANPQSFGACVATLSGSYVLSYTAIGSSPARPNDTVNLVGGDFNGPDPFPAFGTCVQPTRTDVVCEISLAGCADIPGTWTFRGVAGGGLCLTGSLVVGADSWTISGVRQ